MQFIISYRKKKNKWIKEKEKCYLRRFYKVRKTRYYVKDVQYIVPLSRSLRISS